MGYVKGIYIPWKALPLALNPTPLQHSRRDHLGAIDQAFHFNMFIRRVIAVAARAEDDAVEAGAGIVGGVANGDIAAKLGRVAEPFPGREQGLH